MFTEIGHTLGSPVTSLFSFFFLFFLLTLTEVGANKASQTCIRLTFALPVQPFKSVVPQNWQQHQPQENPARFGLRLFSATRAPCSGWRRGTHQQWSSGTSAAVATWLSHSPSCSFLHCLSLNHQNSPKGKLFLWVFQLNRFPGWFPTAATQTTMPVEWGDNPKAWPCSSSKVGTA